MTNETNALLDSDTYYQRDWEVMTLASLVAAGGKVTRVRWLGERAIWDLSYVHGELPDGTPVTLQGLPPAFCVKTSRRMEELILWAREEGVRANTCGLINRANWSELR